MSPFLVGVLFEVLLFSWVAYMFLVAVHIWQAIIFVAWTIPNTPSCAFWVVTCEPLSLRAKTPCVAVRVDKFCETLSCLYTKIPFSLVELQSHSLFS